MLMFILNLSVQDMIFVYVCDGRYDDDCDDLILLEVIEKICDIVFKVDICFLVIYGGVWLMGVCECDDLGVIWFFSDKYSYKNVEIEVDG